MQLDKPIDYSKFQFRAHYAGELMTEPKSGSGLSETCITRLHQIHTSQSTGREVVSESKYIRKGLAVEEESAKLLSLYDEREYDLHNNRMYDDYTQGECDIDDEFEDTIIDLKNAFDVFSFKKNIRETNQNINYWWQGQIYLKHYKRSKYIIANTLCNTPKEIIAQEKKNALYKMGVHKADDMEYEMICSMIDANSIFDDMTIEERVIKTSFNFMPSAIILLHSKLDLCRQELNRISSEDFDRIQNKTILLFTKLPKNVIEAGKKEIKTLISSVVAPVDDDDDIPNKQPDAISTFTEAISNVGELKVRQIDLEESIAVIKSERQEIVQEAFNNLEKCKSLDDTMILYKDSYDVRQISSEFVAALTKKRDEFAAPTPQPTEKPAKKSTVTPVEDDEDELPEPIKKTVIKANHEPQTYKPKYETDSLVSSQEKDEIVKAINSAVSSKYLRETVYKQLYKSQIDADKGLMNYLQKVGTELIQKEMNS